MFSKDRELDPPSSPAALQTSSGSARVMECKKNLSSAAALVQMAEQSPQWNLKWNNITVWWCNNHLEKYEFVNGKDYMIIPYIVENKIHV